MAQEESNLYKFASGCRVHDPEPPGWRVYGERLTKDGSVLLSTSVGFFWGGVEGMRDEG
jgi:hypothetical protein